MIMFYMLFILLIGLTIVSVLEERSKFNSLRASTLERLYELEKRCNQLECKHSKIELKINGNLSPYSAETYYYQKVCSDCGKILETTYDEQTYNQWLKEQHIEEGKKLGLECRKKKGNK